MIPDIVALLIGKDIDDPNPYIKQGWQDGDVNMTGTLILTNEVFSICHGTVVDIGKDPKNNLYSVSVEYEYATWIRYCLLETVNVNKGDEIFRGNKVGTTFKGELRLEYCTDDESEFPFRCGNSELYKQNPEIILSEDIDLPDPDDEVYVEGVDYDEEEEELEEIEMAPNYEDEDNGEEG